MRVLLCFLLPYPGGSAAADRIEKFARGLKEAGAAVFVFGRALGDSSHGCVRGTDGYGIEYFLMPMSREAQGRLGQVRRFFRNIRAYGEAVAELIRRLDIDSVVVYGQSWIYFRNLPAICRRQRARMIMDCTEWHNISRVSLSYFIWPDQLLFIKTMFQRLDGIIAISSFWEAYAQRRRQRYILIPALGEDCGTVRGPAATKLVGTSKTFKIFYMGQMAPRDLPRTLLGAFEEALQVDSNLQLCIVGNVQSKWISYVGGRTTLKHRVTIYGWVPEQDLGSLLDTADCFVLLRRTGRESRACFPTRLPRYLAAAKPVVISRVGDLPRYFEHQQSIWFVPPGKRPKEIAHAFLSLKADAARAKAMGERGRSVGSECFSYKTHGRALREFLLALSA